MAIEMNSTAIREGGLESITLPANNRNALIVTRFNGRNDNLGDILIFDCLLQQLKLYGDIQLIGPAFGAEKPTRLRTALRRALYCRLLGRPLYRVDPPGARLPTGRRLDRQPTRTRLIDAIWNILGARRVRIGISLSPGMYAGDMHRYRWIGVRDHLSQKMLLEHGTKHVHFCPDLAFLLTPVKQPVRKNLRALLSFRALTPDDGSNPHHERILRQRVPQIVALLEDNSLDCEFYYQVDEDQKFIRELATSTSLKRPLPVRDRPSSLEFLRDSFKGADIVISNRLHVLLASAAAGALPIALVSTRHQKIRALFQSMGLEMLIVDLECRKRCEEKIFQILRDRDKNKQIVHDVFVDAGDKVRKEICRMLSIN